MIDDSSLLDVSLEYLRTEKLSGNSVSVRIMIRFKQAWLKGEKWTHHQLVNECCLLQLYFPIL